MRKLLACLLAALFIMTICTSVFAADSVLRFGSKGTAVSSAQRLLKKYGYYSGTINGRYGSETRAAVRAFQKYNGLRIDGTIGPNTKAALNSGSAVPAPLRAEAANKESTVKTVQKLLKNHGYYSGTIDGRYGSSTRAAVRAFQRRNGLSVDGIVGPKTLAALQGANPVNAELGPQSSASADVKHVQQRLAFYGYYKGRIDGKFGSGTLAAVKLFQKANGLTADGVVGPATLAPLDGGKAVPCAAYKRDEERKAQPTISYGAKGDTVKKLQRMLVSLGYSVKVTGTYDKATVSAVKAFQLANHLLDDGKTGPNTWRTLYDKTK